MVAQSPSTRSGDPTTALQLQERDIQICHSLSVMGFATAEALEWLHVQAWPTRYRRYKQSQPADTPQPYYPSTSLYRRLHRLEEHGLIQRVKRTLRRGALTFGRIADAYSLARGGAQLVSRAMQLPLNEVPYVRPGDERSLVTLDHTLLIGRCYASLAAASTFMGGMTIARWRDDRQIRASYDRVSFWNGQRRVEEGLQPDAAFVLHYPTGPQQCFLEVDSGAQEPTRWRNKVRRYEAYRNSNALAARYGVRDFVVLTVVPSWTWAERLALETARETREAGPRYRFLPENLVHPTTVRINWKCIETVTWTRKIQRDRVVEVPTVTLSETQELWSATQK